MNIWYFYQIIREELQNDRYLNSLSSKEVENCWYAGAFGGTSMKVNKNGVFQVLCSKWRNATNVHYTRIHWHPDAPGKDALKLIPIEEEISSRGISLRASFPLSKWSLEPLWSLVVPVQRTARFEHGYVTIYFLKYLKASHVPNNNGDFTFSLVDRNIAGD